MAVTSTHRYRSELHVFGSQLHLHGKFNPLHPTVEAGSSGNLATGRQFAIAPSRRYVAMACGSTFIVLADAEGLLYFHGNDASGTFQNVSWTDFQDHQSQIIQLAAGAMHFAVLTHDGMLHSVDLAKTTNENESQWQALENLSDRLKLPRNLIQVVAVQSTTYALTSEGDVLRLLHPDLKEATMMFHQEGLCQISIDMDGRHCFGLLRNGQVQQWLLVPFDNHHVEVIKPMLETPCRSVHCGRGQVLFLATSDELYGCRISSSPPRSTTSVTASTSLSRSLSDGVQTLTPEKITRIHPTFETQMKRWDAQLRAIGFGENGENFIYRNDRSKLWSISSDSKNGDQTEAEKEKKQDPALLVRKTAAGGGFGHSHSLVLVGNQVFATGSVFCGPHPSPQGESFPAHPLLTIPRFAEVHLACGWTHCAMLITRRLRGSWDAFPTDVLSHICTWLRPSEVSKLGATCSFGYEAACQDLVWEPFLRKKFPVCHRNLVRKHGFRDLFIRNSKRMNIFAKNAKAQARADLLRRYSCRLFRFPEIDFSGMASRAQEYWEGPEANVLIVGLWNAGKTALLYRWFFGENVTTIPTIGYNVEMIRHRGRRFRMWDVPSYWNSRQFYPQLLSDFQAKALVFVVDSADTEHFDEAVAEFHKLREIPQYRETPALLLANKQDLDEAVGVIEIAEMFGVINNKSHEGGIKGPSHIIGTVVTNGQGLTAGLDWLRSTLFGRTGLFSFL